ncbi:amidohydrolase family protein [Natronorubrum sp. FCH18a]|uniref:amidohydrolase family protein n=1 Tax=Natronorubrum sp. FCH18a TaxID=3447018 RepID=UPI003F51270A
MNQTIIDGEWHSAESGSEIREYLSDEELRENERSGYTAGPDDWGPIQWDGWDRSAGGRSSIEIHQSDIEVAEDVDTVRERLGIDRVVFSPGQFRMTTIPAQDKQVPYMRALNDLTVDHFAKGDGTYYAKLFVMGDHPKESAEEIERYADEDGIVGAMITDVGPTFPMGHKSYEPLYEAAEKHDIPIILHSTTGIVAGFPITGMQPTNFAEFHTLAHTVPKMWHANSLIQRGIPERYDVDIGFWEGGISWVPALAERLDREYLERSSEFADLSQLPSEYLSEFYYGTQPLPEPETKMIDFVDLIDRTNLEDQIVYTSDRPHQDFDAPAAVDNIEGLNDEQRHKIFSENATELFGL